MEDSTTLLGLTAFVLAITLGWVLRQWFSLRRGQEIIVADLVRTRDQLATCTTLRSSGEAEAAGLRRELERAKPYLAVADAVAEAESISAVARAETERLRAEAKAEVEVLRRESREQAKERVEKASQQLVAAGEHASKIVEDAKSRAEEIAGDAYKALKNADHLKQVVDAMRNKIEGYGDRYLVPTYSLLDELADAYGFAEAGQELKRARERSQLLVEQGRAATCEYVEDNRRETAIRFVLDAFNGKVDSILSRTKADNVGTLRQQIVDAFAMVNFNGKAFRDARVTEEYLQARLEELKWAAAALALRDQERDEQRRIKAQIREEERAIREFERAQKEAEREEAAVRKAIARMQEQVARATDEQKLKYEAQLADLAAKLTEAEAKGQRALSMAQQTKSGHVYVISNIGSFGENVYKIGMTRRLEPLDRIRELGDASVPFAFDVHAMIYSEDAPHLERGLHRQFLASQINKVNPRKEFFRVTIAALKAAADAAGLKAAWTLASDAAEYRESTHIDERIKADPIARQHWLEHQMLLDPVAQEAAEEVAQS